MKSKQLSKILCLVLALCLCVAMLPTTAVADGAYSGKTVVLYTGNIRGDVDKLPQIAAAKKSYEAAGAEVVLLDAGNYLQGTRYSTVDAGKTLISLMQQAGYDALAMGRYDFAFGTGMLGTSYHGNLRDLGSLSDFFDSSSGFYVAGDMKLVAANITGQNENFFGISENQTITSVGGLKIGVFGLTAPDTVYYTLETNLLGMNFGDATSAASAQVSALAGSDVVIGLSNAGVSNVTGASMIDISADAGFTVGALVIDNNSKDVTEETVTLSDSDTAIADAVSAWKSSVTYATPVVSSSVTLNGSTAANRGEETNIGDLWADAILWYATSGNIEDSFSADYKATFGDAKIYVDNDHVVALWNGGNLREYLNPGEVTMTDIERVLPYPNYISVAYLKGSELLEQLEACSQGLPYSSTTSSVCASFMQVAGINYTVKTGITYNAGDSYNGKWSKLKDGKSNGRVTITSINGKAFDPNALYCVVTHDKNSRSGMDASYVLKEPKYDENNWSTYTEKDVCEIVLEYIKIQLGGTIGSTYAGSQGRITISSEGTTGGASGGSTTPSTEDSFTIKVTQTIGGEISPSTTTVKKSDDQTFTITASKKYKVTDVLVDGTSVGAVSSYTFSKVTAAHTISAVYAAADGAWSNPYSDVDKSAWYFSSVEYVTINSLMNGVSDNKFEPESSMTRGMFVTMLYRLAGSPSVVTSTAFNDVAEGVYYSNAVAWAVQKGITTGASGSSFAPNSIMTRQEMATFIYRYYGSPSVQGTLSFGDQGQMSSWANNAILYCVQNDLMNGVSDTEFSPSGTANRAMGATILSRMNAAA